MRKFYKWAGLNVLPVKCLYFFVKMQIFSFYFFRGPFCTSRFDISQGDWGKNAGTLLSITFFTNMVIAYFNDRYRRPRLVLSILLIGATISFEMLFLIDRSSVFLFWLALACYLLFETGVTPLLDHHCIQFLQNTPGTDPTAYGRQRLWGAIAYMVTNYITESLCKNHDNTFNFEPLKYSVPLLTVPGLVVIFLVVQNYGERHQINKNSRTADISDGMNRKTPENIVEETNQGKPDRITNNETDNVFETRCQGVLENDTVCHGAPQNVSNRSKGALEKDTNCETDKVFETRCQGVLENVTVCQETPQNVSNRRRDKHNNVTVCQEAPQNTAKNEMKEIMSKNIALSVRQSENEQRINMQEEAFNNRQGASQSDDISDHVGFKRLSARDAEDEAVKHTGMVSPAISSETNGSFGRQFRQLLRNPDFLFFILLIFLNGITRSANNLYISLYQTRVLKLRGFVAPALAPIPVQRLINCLGDNAISTANSCSTVIEMLFLFLSLNITKHFGLYWPLFFAQVAQTIRNLGYFLMPPGSKSSFLITCFLETAKGVNFSLTHASGVQIVNNIAPINLKSTAQIIYAGAFFSLSSLISGQTFGRLFGPLKDENNYEKQLLSFKQFFCMNVCINIMFLFLFIIKYGLFDRRLPFSVFIGRQYHDKEKQTKAIVKDQDIINSV